VSRARRFNLFLFDLFVSIRRESYAYLTRSFCLSVCLGFFLVCHFYVHGIWYICVCFCYRSSSDSFFLFLFLVSLFFCSFAFCLPCFRSAAAAVSHLGSCPLHIAPLYQPTHHPHTKKNNLYTKFSQQPARKIKSEPPSRIHLASQVFFSSCPT